MKRYLLLAIVFVCSTLLIGCATNKPNPYPSADLTQEHWQRLVQVSPNSWARGADRWFMTGDPNMVEESNMNAPYAAAISTTQVRVPDFNSIEVDGPFEVQLFGADGQNSVFVYGPNNAVRQVAIDVRGRTLCIHVASDVKANCNLNKVIVRVGVMNLNRLVQLGSGRIEGRQVRSNCLTIISKGCGNIYLAGNVYLRGVTSNVSTVSVFGAVSPRLDILTNGKGSVNVSGDVALASVTHHGSGDINIIGANGGAAKIGADGCGKISISGRPTICEITAKDTINIYAYYVNSRALYVYQSNRSRVGLAGCVNNLYVDTSGVSRFEGRNLQTMSAYARAHDASHINIAANGQMYAALSGNSSIYFFGSPNILSQYINGNGIVIPIWNGCNRPVYPNCFGTPIYKDRAPAVRAMPMNHYPRSRWQKKHCG